MKYIFYVISILLFGLFILLSQVEDTIVKEYGYKRLERQFDGFLIKVVLYGKEKKISRLSSEIRNPYSLLINISKPSNGDNRVVIIKRVSLSDIKSGDSLNLLIDKTKMKFKKNQYHPKFDIFLAYRDIILDAYNMQRLSIEFYFENNPSEIYLYEGIFEKNYKEETISVWDIFLFAT